MNTSVEQIQKLEPKIKGKLALTERIIEKKKKSKQGVYW